MSDDILSRAFSILPVLRRDQIIMTRVHTISSRWIRPFQSCYSSDILVPSQAWSFGVTMLSSTCCDTEHNRRHHWTVQGKSHSFLSMRILSAKLTSIPQKSGLDIGRVSFLICIVASYLSCKYCWNWTNLGKKHTVVICQGQVPGLGEDRRKH